MSAETPLERDVRRLLPDAEIVSQLPLAPWTSVRVGGAAELSVRPMSVEGLPALLRMLRDEGIPLTLLGGGANSLVGDLGVPGVTLRMPGKVFPEVLEELPDGALRVTLGSGAAIARLITVMKKHERVGAEFLAGIPGTLGGAVTMNAGTKNGECMRVVAAVEVATTEGLHWLAREALSWKYRHTFLPEGCVVTRIRFLLPKGDIEPSRDAMAADLGYRKRTQPLTQPNFGSVFTNPEGGHAGALIEQVGLKGHRIGQAQISPKHANWIVNLGGATAQDVVGLMELMRSKVLAETGVTLTPEVKRIGRFRPPEAV